MLNTKRMLAGLIVSQLFLTACTSTQEFFGFLDEEEIPAPLPDIKQEVKLDKVWSTSIGEGQGDEYNRLVPAIHDDKIYITDAEGVVASVNRKTGKKQWQVELDLPVSGGIGAGGVHLIVGTLEGDVLALNQANGEILWRTKVSSEVLAVPKINRDMAVVQTIDGKLHGLEAENGKRRWIYETQVPILTLRGSSNPILTPEVSIAGFSSGKLVVVENQQGVVLWERRLAAPKGHGELNNVIDVDGDVLLVGGVIYGVNYQGNLMAIDASKGRPLWTQEASSYVGLSEGLGNIYVVNDNGHVQAMNQQSGVSVWSQDKLERRQLTAPAAFNNYLVVGDVEGYLHVISQLDGHFVGRYHVDGSGLRAQLLAADNMLYALANDGSLVALKIH